MILRIDDYPSGIRPIQDGQIEMFGRMLNELPAMFLGIVPTTYDSFDCKLHETHENVIPCMHGYTHGYEKHSGRLTSSGDIFNNNSIGVFNEFEGLERENILTQLKTGKKSLEQRFGRDVNTYIPCCNIIDEPLCEMLAEVGFRNILCEKEVKSPIPIIRSDYYGKLDKIDFKKRYWVVTLHITWEWDIVRVQGWDYWLDLVKKFRDGYLI